MLARPGDSRSSHRPAKRPAARLAVLLVTVLAALPLCLGGCGARVDGDTSATAASTSLSEAAQQQTADQEAAASVRDFFATGAAGHLSGLTIDKLEVTTEPSGQVLFLTVTSDNSGEAMNSLDWIYEGAMTPDNWPAHLANERGVRLVAIRFIVNYPTGEPNSIHIDVGSGASSEGGKPRFEAEGPPGGTPAPTEAP